MAAGSGNFISKPARGWLHPDHLVSKEGITYAVRVSELEKNIFRLLERSRIVEINNDYFC